MKSLGTEIMAIMLITIDATLWLPKKNQWCAAHIITFTCQPTHRLVSGAMTAGLSREQGYKQSISRAPPEVWPKELCGSLLTSSQPRFSPSLFPSSFFSHGDAGKTIKLPASGAPTLSVHRPSLQSWWRFISLLPPLMCGRESPAPAFLKAHNGPRGAGKGQHAKATLIC